MRRYDSEHCFPSAQNAERAVQDHGQMLLGRVPDYAGRRGRRVEDLRYRSLVPAP